MDFTSPIHLLLIILVIVLLFGGKKIPELMKGIVRMLIPFCHLAVRQASGGRGGP
jgi:TatA/E family protein of Tat protein translocase